MEFTYQMFDEYSEMMTNYIYNEKYSKISQPHFLDHSVTLPSSQAQALQCRLRDDGEVEKCNLTSRVLQRLAFFPSRSNLWNRYATQGDLTPIYPTFPNPISKWTALVGHRCQIFNKILRN